MATAASDPQLAFVWCPREISSSVVEMARRTGTRAIFDLSSAGFEALATALIQADAGADCVDLKLAADSILDRSLEEFLEETGINRLWVELHPVLLHAPMERYLERMQALAHKFDLIPVVGSQDLVATITRACPQIRNIALKGSEAAGFVGLDGIFALYGSVREQLRLSGTKSSLHVWGGIATPEAAAAFLSTGARGLVFEALHWLTDMVKADDKVRDKVSNLRPDHMELVGLNLDVPCRLFNKGNSKAVRDLRDFAGSLCGSEIREEQRRFFADRIVKEAVPALEGRFDRDQLIPLGIEAAFAGSFVRRFGWVTEDAFPSFKAQITELLGAAPQKARAFQNSPAAMEMGTEYPFVQGAMSWITDVPEFTLRVAQAGGLPTVALGMMDPGTLRDKLGGLAQTMGDRPYAVNVIALAENPFLAEQLQWICDVKPKFAVIAAGEPSHARRLQDAGCEPIYIAPTEELLRLAFAAGIRWVICEGNEAGGHVGQHTTATLAQMVLNMKDSEPGLFHGKRVILAGGIFNRETAFMAAMLGADAVQMGTVYLASREIVETGALTRLYQEMVLSSGPGGTTLTGEATGLRVRSLRTPRIASICSLEREFAAAPEDEAAFRQKIEALAAGSLLVAARGVNRPGGEPLCEQECRETGQFMSGACAGAIKKVRTMAELHKELATGSLEDTFADGLAGRGEDREPCGSGTHGILQGPSRSAAQADGATHSVGQTFQSAIPPFQAGKQERIAITGMSIVNSLGNSPEEVWAASLAMKSGITVVPPARWNHEIFFNPRPRVSEKTYCRVGAFQDLDVDRKELGIPPQDFRTMTDSTKVTMWLAHRAVNESGILDSDIPRDRIGVLISQNSGEAAATLRDVIIRGAVDKIVASVKRVVPLDPATELAVEEAVKEGRIAVDDTTLLGRLNCSAGGFICNKYGFMGPSYSVSAACATALVALYAALQMIRNGIIDAAVIGGAEETLTPMHFLEFSALGALAGLSGIERPPVEASRPFDKDRDGMVLGEGGGMIVIERESVARRRGARAHAYITAMGASNNHLGMVESSRETQKMAIDASFKDCSYGPDAVDLVECHATSTKQGDTEEVHAIRSVVGPGSPLVLASFKSQIGHTLGASGVNSLIRGIMAMKAKTLPGTLNFHGPDPEMEMEKSAMRVNALPDGWHSRNGHPRRFQVNAFGFGGSNYVVQVEEALEEQATVLVSTPEIRREARLPEGLFLFTTSIGPSTYRLGVVADSEEQAVSKVRNADAVDGDTVAPKRLRSFARQGLHLGPTDGGSPPLAFMFPGQGSHYAGMGHELYNTYPVIKEWMDRAAEVAEFDLLRLVFFDKEEDLQKTRWQQPALFTMEYSMVQYLWALGIRPTALAGHSLGELTALCLAGVYSFEDGFRLVNKRAVCMDKACDINVDPGVMMAVDAPMDVIEEKLAFLDHVYITNINSPNQLVLGGDTEAVKDLGEELKKLGYRRTLLRVSMAFHSPIMRCIHDELEEFVDGLEFHAPQIPVISNTTMGPFPSDPAEIKKIVMAHLESPVHWMQNTHTLWNDYGVRLFVEVGPRDILSNLVSDCIEGAECVQTCLPSAETMIYRTALAQLYAKGHLQTEAKPEFVSFPGSGAAEEHPGASRQCHPAIEQCSPPIPRALPSSPLAAIVQRTINGFVLESFGRFIRPMLLDAICKEHDPNFSEEQLHSLLTGIAGPAVSIPVVPVSMGAVPARSLPAAAVVGRASGLKIDKQDAGPTAPTPPQEPAKSDTDDVAETVIRIIMDATGYDRDEIDLSMDLREDLSIRSSRLPVIMDAVESHFNIKIELEDFIGVRTVGQIADRISVVLEKSQGPGGPAKASSSVRSSVAGAPDRGPGKAFPSAVADPGTAPAVQALQPAQRPPTKRLVFVETPIVETEFRPVEADSMESLAIWSAYGGTGLRRRVAAVFRRDYGITSIPLSFLPRGPKHADDEFDLLADEGITRACERLDGTESLSGMVLVFDDTLEQSIKTGDQAARTLKGMFSIMKAFLRSPSKKFVVALSQCSSPEGLGRVVYDGVLGMFLSMAHEFSSVQFRSVRIDEKTDLRLAVRQAMNRTVKPLELIWHGGTSHKLEGKVQYARYPRGGLPACQPTGKMPVPPAREDVVIFSGGGYGITAHLATGLIPYGCKMVFLGRTALDEQMDYPRLLAEGKTSPAELKSVVQTANPGMAKAELERTVSDVSKGLEITRTLERLLSAGIDATYFQCDVTDAARVEEVVAEVSRRYGKITGIVHGAGMLRDRFVAEMDPDDFVKVNDVKLLGAWNLIKSAENRGVRFVCCLSSAAAIQGNPGQSNYSSGNRAMSALAANLRETCSSVVFKAFMLPPIEGAGMADNPETRAFMRRMNASYLQVTELTELLWREVFLGPQEDVWVMFMGTLPQVETAPLDTSDPVPDPDCILTGTGSFNRRVFPMIDSVSIIDLQRGDLEALRSFSLSRDLWIADHKPFKFLKRPLVSAIMAIETFMEVSKLLLPYLTVQGIRDARFIDIIQCPPNVERSSVVKCGGVEVHGDVVTCEVTLDTREVSPSGRVMERMIPKYSAQVVLGAGSQAPPASVPGFPVNPEELDSRPMEHSEVIQWYVARTDLTGRYRVVDRIEGSSPGAIRGTIEYHESDDFSDLSNVTYQYSPYLLEALMQLVNFFVIMREPNETRAMIPFGIGEMLFFRKCRDGESITIEARIHNRTEEGLNWAARAVDQDGRTIMLARDISMRWFTG